MGSAEGELKDHVITSVNLVQAWNHVLAQNTSEYQSLLSEREVFEHLV